MRKLPVYIVGEATLALVVASVPLAWWLGWLTMPWLYVVGFVIGTVYTTAGSAAQIVLTQVVPRERLVEARARTLASSGAEVAGLGFAGVLIRLVGAPLALLVDAAMLLFSAAILRGIVVDESAAHCAPTRTSGATCAPACASCAASACWWRWPARWASGRCAITPRWWCRSFWRRARWACRSRPSG